MVTTPAEQVLSQITGVEHVMSISKPGVAVLAVQFKVGVPRIEALVRLHDAVNAHADWLPRGLGVGPPLIKPRGIDDVPIVALTLYARIGPSVPRSWSAWRTAWRSTSSACPARAKWSPWEAPAVPRWWSSIAAHGQRRRHRGGAAQALQAANVGAPWASCWAATAPCGRGGPYLRDAQEVGELVVGVRNGKPSPAGGGDGARRRAAREALCVARRGWGEPAEYPAVTIQISKKPGENAIDVADGVLRRVDELRNTVIPQGVEVVQSRNYGITANDKVAGADPQAAVRHRLRGGLVFVTLGRREAAIVGAAVVLTLAATCSLPGPGASRSTACRCSP
jgi:Cu/Ag efflux pump CusA